MTEQDQVSEEATETVTDGLHPTFKLPMDHPALKALEDARNEAAGTRIKKNKAAEEMAEKAKAWEEHVNAQKSELERMSDRAAAQETELKALKTENSRKTIMNEFKLDADLEDLISGDDDEMRRKAKTLAEKFNTKSDKQETMETLAGNRGTPVTGGGSGNSAGAEWFKKFTQ